MSSVYRLRYDEFGHDKYSFIEWSHQSLFNMSRVPRGYGYVSLDDLREGDRAGFRISDNGVLEFTVNGKSQGIAAENVYFRNFKVYAIVEHRYGVATVITKAGEKIQLRNACTY